MNRRWVLGAFLAVCAAQIAVPALMIRTYEATLARGRAFKVRCETVDPVDAFRGRYVWLSLDLPAPEGYKLDMLSWGQRVWAVIEEGPDGFARAASFHRKRPPGEEVVPVRYVSGRFDPERNRPGEPRFRLEIDRYYVSEILAPESEREFRAHARRVGLENAGRGALEAYATVRVLDGVAVIEGLHVAGMPIEAYIELPQEDRDRLLAKPEPRAP